MAQPTTSSVTASGGVGVALSTLVTWALKTHGVEVPAEVQAAIYTLITGLVGWFIHMEPGVPLFPWQAAPAPVATPEVK
jgi:hypothetical protein